MTKIKAKDILFLHVILFVYSIGSVCSKLASKSTFLSGKFILFYGLVLAILFVYAILWQQVLKRMPLTTAFANKAVVIVWGILFGRLLFGEPVSLLMILGSVLIFFGIVLVVRDHE